MVIRNTYSLQIYTYNYDLYKSTWFQAGGNCDFFCIVDNCRCFFTKHEIEVKDVVPDETKPFTKQFDFINTK